MESSLRFVIETKQDSAVRGTQQVAGELKKMGGAAEQASTQGRRSADVFAGALSGVGKVAAAVGIGFGALQVANLIRGWTNDALRFQQEMANVNTLLGGSGTTVDELRQQVLGLSGALGSSTELTRALYQAISAGIEPARAVEFVAQAATLAKAGLVSASDAVNVLATATNAYGLEADRATELSDIMFQAVRLGRVTVQELAGSLGKTIPQAAQLGISFAELNAATVAITSTGKTTSEAMSGLNQVIANLANPTEKARQTAERLGIDFGLAGLQAKGFTGFLDELTRAVEGDIQAQADLFGSIEAFGSIASLTSQGGAAAFIAALKAMEEAAGTTTTAMEKQTGTVGQQMSRLWNNLSTEFTIAAGEAGALARALDTLNDALEAGRGLFSDLLRAGFAGEIGPLRRRFIMSPHEEELQRLKDARTGVDALTKSLFDLSPTVEEVNRLVETSTGNVKKFTEEQNKLITTFRNTLRPADELGKELDFLIAQFGKDRVVRVYADEILEVARRHEKLNGPGSLPATIQLLRDEARAIADAERAWHSFVTNLKVDDLRPAEEAFQRARTGGIDPFLASLEFVPPTGDAAADTIAFLTDQAKDFKLEVGELPPAIADWIREQEKLNKLIDELAIRTFDRLIERLADVVVEWRGFWKALVDTAKSFAKAIIETLLQELLSPLKSILEGAARGIAGLFKGQGFSVGGGGAAQKGFDLGLGPLGGALKKFGGGIFDFFFGQKSFDIVSGNVSRTGGLFQPSGPLGALGPGLGGALAGFAPGFAIGGPLGGGIGGALGAAAGLGVFGDAIAGAIAGPIGLAISAAFTGIKALVGLRNDRFEKSSIEIGRDFGGIGVSDDIVRAFQQLTGIPKDALKGFRKDILSSPKFLTEVTLPAAIAQGKLEDFLTSLERIDTVAGQLNLREEMELFILTGDATKLNEKFFEFWNTHLPAAAAAIPGFTDVLAAADNETRKLLFSTAEMLLKFQETGELTPELSARIQELGGDLAAFEAASRLPELNNTNQALSAFRQALADSLPPLVDVNGNLNQSINLFLQTGQVTEKLRQTFVEFGGDLAVLDEAAQLPGLRQTRNEFAQLQAEIDKLLPKQETAMELFLRTGQVTDELAAKILAAGGSLQAFTEFGNLRTAADELARLRGALKDERIIQQLIPGTDGAAGIIFRPTLDPQSLEQIVDLIDLIAGSDTALGDTLLGQLNDILLNGGDLDQFFDLLETQLEARTKTTAQILSDQLQEMQDTIGNQMTEITNRMIAEIDRIMLAVGNQIADINTRLVDAIKELTDAIEGLNQAATNFPGGGGGGGAPGAGRIGDIPSFDNGGLVSRSGLAFVHQGERVIPAGGGGDITLNLTVNSGASDPKEVAGEVVTALLNNKGGSFRRLNDGLGLRQLRR